MEPQRPDNVSSAGVGNHDLGLQPQGVRLDTGLARGVSLGQTSSPQVVPVTIEFYGCSRECLVLETHRNVGIRPNGS